MTIDISVLVCNILELIFKARRAGIILYSIGIGPETEQAELERIAGQAKRVYHVDSYDDITQLKKSIGIDLSECVSPLGLYPLVIDV